MSPLMIEILIHYYVTGGVDYGPPRLDAPAVADAINAFLRRGLLFRYETIYPNEKPKKDTPIYIANRDALEPYVNALCRVPLPVKRWVILEEKNES